MKQVLAIFLFTVFISEAYAQCENSYYPTKEGTKFETTSYNKKGKQMGMVLSKVTQSSQTSDGVNFTIESEIKDKKGESLNTASYDVYCSNGSVKIDLRNFIPSEILEQYENMKVTFEGDFLEIPNNLETGITLPEATGKMSIQMGSDGAVGVLTEITFEFKDRKVEGQESLTTPAGTFETYKISQTTVSIMSIMGMKRTTEIKSASWVAKNVGIVKSEGYDKKGAMRDYTLLTSFSQ